MSGSQNNEKRNVKVHSNICICREIEQTTQNGAHKEYSLSRR